MNLKKPGFWIVAVIIVVCILTCVNVISRGKKANQTTEQTSEQVAEQVSEQTSEQASSQTEYVTYEFETFDGTAIKIDESNILSQEAVENVLETSMVPVDADVIAPGRDYVYLEDESFYYVEDAAKGLLTIASKGEESEYTAEAREYSCDDFSFYYEPECFAVFVDEEGTSVTLSYDKPGVEVAGSNVVTFSKVDETDCEKFIKEKAKECGGTEDDIIEVYYDPANVKKAYTYSYFGEPTESGLETIQLYYVFQGEKNVILADGFRTMGPDGSTEMTIDTSFINVIQSFRCK